MRKMKKAAKIIAAIIIITLTLSALILDSKSMTLAIIGAIETCLYTIIPALFGFMAVSAYLIKSGLYRIIFKPLYLIMHRAIRLDEEEFGIFLLSQFGGYPVGAKLLADSKGKQACLPENSPLPYCYCPSPGFVIAVVGIGLFSNPAVGLAVYLSNMLACVILAVFLNLNRKKITGGFKNPPLQLTQDTFTSSIMSASSALFPVCAVVVAFGVIGGVLSFIGLENPLFFAFLEISNVSSLTPDLRLLPLIAAMFSFGGVCIIMQVPAIAKGRLHLKSFFLWRFPAAVLSALICRLLMQLVDFTVYIPASTIIDILPTESASPVASVCLLIMAVILVQTAGEEKTG
jgi:hypothetical protein